MLLKLDEREETRDWVPRHPYREEGEKAWNPADHPRDPRTGRFVRRGVSAEWLSAAADLARAEYDVRAGAAGLTPDQYRARRRKRIADLVKGSKVRIRVPWDVFSEVMSDGRLKNQHEADQSRGAFNPRLRAQVEAQLFGTGDLRRRYAAEQTGLQVPPMSPEIASTAPIYGYLSVTEKADPNATTWIYGEVVLELKDTVRDRTTFTLGDSLDDTAMGREAMVAPAALTAPHEYAAPVWARVAGDDHHVVSEVGYVEAQVHGGVSIGDVERVVFTEGMLPPYETIEKMDEAGVPFEIVLRTDPDDKPSAEPR